MLNMLKMWSGRININLDEEAKKDEKDKERL